MVTYSYANRYTLTQCSNIMDGMFSQLLRPHLNRIYPCVIEEVRQNTQKELRIINALEPIMNQHRLILDPQVIIDDHRSAIENYTPELAPQYMLIYQLTRVTKERGALKHDDRLDVLAMAVQFFVDMLGLDQKAAEQRRLDDAWDKEMEQWLRSIDDRHSEKRLNCIDRVYDNIKSGRLR